MGTACSCLKQENQENYALNENHEFKGRVVGACEVQRVERKDVLSDKSLMKHGEKGIEPCVKSEHDSPEGICDKTKKTNQNESISPHETFHNSFNGNQAEEEKEGKPRRRSFVGLESLNGMKKPKALLLQQNSAVSSPVGGELSPHSPHSTSSLLATLSPASRRSAEIVRDFAERINRRILSIGREAEDGMEIAWFCDRKREKNERKTVRVQGEEGGEMDDIVEGFGGESGEEDSGRKGAVEGKSNGKETCEKVQIVEKCSEKPSKALVEYFEVEQIEKMTEHDSRRRSMDEGGEMRSKESDSRDTVKEQIEYYEKLNESGRMDCRRYVDKGKIKKRPRKISMKIALKARKFGGMEDEVLGDATVLIV